ncbi:MFS transporter [Rhizobium sp. NPDC090279]|uniref:MFS transporter n=1 Tax=Rhizobium sp. NPDC090279 TaxID=3364499 RepID=UPI00383A4DC1
MSSETSIEASFWKRAARFRALVPVMVAICVIGTGNSLLTTSVSLSLSRPEIDPSAVQLLLTGFPVGFLTGCLVARFLVARLGHRGTFLTVSFLAALAGSGYMVTTVTSLWLVLRFLNGFAMAVLFVVSESWINLYADQNNRGAYFSLYMMMTSLAVLFGQLMVEAAGPHSPHLFLIGGLTVTAGALYCRFVGRPWPTLPVRSVPPLQAEVSAADHRCGLWKLAALAPVTIIAVFQAGMTNMNVFALMPLYGAKIALPAATTIGMVTAFSMGGMLAQTPVGWLSDRLDRRWMLLVQGILAAMLCAAIIMLANRHVPVLFVLFFLYGATALTIYPVGIAFANSQIDSRHMVSASGGLLLIYSIGNVMTPGIAAGLMDYVAPYALFIMLGSGAALVSVGACVNLRRKRTSSTANAVADCLTSGVNQ